jgi:hypothetical protein
VKQARVLPLPITMMLFVAAAAPASAGGPNALFKFRGHPVADAGWEPMPGRTSYIGEVCVDTGVSLVAARDRQG